MLRRWASTVGRPPNERSEIGIIMFPIKAEVSDQRAETFAVIAQKTMYEGKHIAKGDTIFVFASENEGGLGLIASGVVTSAKAIAKKPNVARQTPRVSITVRRTALAKRRLGRDELKRFSDWNDGRPETELNFKFYRQATNKIIGISDEAAAFLRGFFQRGRADKNEAPNEAEQIAGAHGGTL
jgi:hypothetical protein